LIGGHFASIVPVAAAGASDIVARIMADAMTRRRI
jgi:tripartite-type tricarboxylate transporter receptor subunit TctC